MDPWPESWLAAGKPSDQLFIYEFDCTPEQLWPYLADTSAFSEAMRMPEVSYEDAEGGRRIGRSTTGGFISEWVEPAWEWEFGRTFRFTRLFHQGALRYNRVRYRLQPLPAGRTRVYIHIGFIGRGTQGRFAVWMTERMIARRHGDVAKRLAEAIKTGQPFVPRVGEQDLESTANSRLIQGQTALARYDVDEEVAAKLVRHLAEGQDDELEKIRVLVLARTWNVEVGTLLDVCLAATKVGLLRLSWDIVCPHCRGSRNELAHLGDLLETAACEPCGIEFGATGAESIEVAFRVHQSIRVIEKRMYCSAEVAGKPHIVVQRLVEGGQSEMATPQLAPGRYRLRTRGEMGYRLLDVEATGSGGEVFVWAYDKSEDHARVGEQATFQLVNDSDEPRLFVIEHHAVDRDALRPVELFSNQSFRELFSEQAIATNIQLDVGMQTIVFTDIVGSTAFYERAGDADAFAAVRSHFVEIYGVVRRFHGAVVKTIGDAAMAAFGNPRDALACAIEIQRLFPASRADSPIRLRTSLHHGPCIAVNLNAGVDYFGRTVNLAAKLQAIAAAHQIVCTREVVEDPEVRAWLDAQSMTPQSVAFEPGWSHGAIAVHRLDVTSLPA